MSAVIGSTVKALEPIAAAKHGIKRNTRTERMLIQRDDPLSTTTAVELAENFEVPNGPSQTQTNANAKKKKKFTVLGHRSTPRKVTYRK